VVELSDKVGATPVSDSRHTTGSHLGRAFAGAYRGDDECAGGLGTEVGALAWPAVSSGASPAMALRRSCYCCGARERRKKRGRSGETEWRVGARGGVPTRLSRSAAARPTPAYDRQVAGAGWSEAGTARGRERGGEAGRAVWLG